MSKSLIQSFRFLPKIKTGGLRPIVTFKNENVTQQLSETRAVLDLIMEENKRAWVGVHQVSSIYAQYTENPNFESCLKLHKATFANRKFCRYCYKIVDLI